MAGQRVAYQGTAGAYSHMACQKVFPECEVLPCDDFSGALALVIEGQADCAMIPLENSTAGRVEEIYRLIPSTHLSVVAEHFEPVRHCLLARAGTSVDQLTHACSHPQALAQCHQHLRHLGIRPVASIDTAIAARDLAGNNEPGRAVIASELAAELYGLEILRRDFQDVDGNTTRFLVFAREQQHTVALPGVNYITSLLFTVRNLPAALYKALGGFATNGVNLIKLESYMDGGTMEASHFHLDVHGHQASGPLANALEELSYFSQELRILGSYPAHSYRSRTEFV